MRTWYFLTQFFDCVDGVRGRFALQFAIVAPQTALRLRSRCATSANGLPVSLPNRFYEGKARRNKNDSFERESLQSEARQNQVGVMHRIESAAVNADLCNSIKKVLAALAS